MASSFNTANRHLWKQTKTVKFNRRHSLIPRYNKYIYSRSIGLLYVKLFKNALDYVMENQKYQVFNSKDGEARPKSHIIRLNNRKLDLNKIEIARVWVSWWKLLTVHNLVTSKKEIINNNWFLLEWFTCGKKSSICVIAEFNSSPIDNKKKLQKLLEFTVIEPVSSPTAAYRSPTELQPDVRTLELKPF